MQPANLEHAGSKITHIPGETGIWVVIVGDMLVFGLMFLTFMYYRRDELTLFRLSQSHLNQTLGLANTLLMITSSLFVSLSVQAAIHRKNRLALFGFALASLSGAAFCLIKISEYWQAVKAGFSIDTNEFYTFYYVFTGIHLLHVLIGIAVLVFLMSTSRSTEKMTVKKLGYLESGASFWHLVDLLWIALFALLYLLK